MTSHSQRYYSARMLLPAAALMLMAACTCSPGDVSADPNCPGGRRAAASLTINIDFSKIRPIGTTIQLNVRGNRTSTDVCFAADAQSSFSFPNEQGTTTKTESLPKLADGSWTIDIVALSGGDQAPVHLTPTFNPGAAHTLTITGTASGDLTATFS